jgi:hypothetical protein
MAALNGIPLFVVMIYRGLPTRVGARQVAAYQEGFETDASQAPAPIKVHVCIVHFSANVKRTGFGFLHDQLTTNPTQPSDRVPLVRIMWELVWSL